MLILVQLILILVAQSHSFRHHFIRRLVRSSSQELSNKFIDHHTWGLYITQDNPTNLRLTRLLSDGQGLLESKRGQYSFTTKKQQNEIIQLFRVFRSQYDSLKVPHKYIIPRDSTWPEYSWDMKLGKVVKRLRKVMNKLDSSFLRELNDLGFIWNVSDYLFLRHCHAVKTFISIYGNVTIPSKFVVPDSDAWDKDMHGYRLGSSVGRIRKNLLYHEQIQKYTTSESAKTSSKRLVWDTVSRQKGALTRSLNRKVLSYFEFSLTSAELVLAEEAFKIYRRRNPTMRKVPFRYIIRSVQKVDSNEEEKKRIQ
jgi:hypothetical protein